VLTPVIEATLLAIARETDELDRPSLVVLFLFDEETGVETDQEQGKHSLKNLKWASEMRLHAGSTRMWTIISLGCDNPSDCDGAVKIPRKAQATSFRGIVSSFSSV
jgi:hypothetical protein